MPSKPEKHVFIDIVLIFVGLVVLGFGIWQWKTGGGKSPAGQQPPSSSKQKQKQPPSSPSQKQPPSSSKQKQKQPPSSPNQKQAPSSSKQKQKQPPSLPPSGALGQPCHSNGQCNSGLWCNSKDKHCYQSCTQTKNMCTPSLVPRKNTYECNYDAPECSANAGKIGQVCGPNNTCQAGGKCQNGYCYEICGVSGSCTPDTMPRKNTYWCDPTAAQCNAGRPTAPTILSTIPALTIGGPPAYPAQMGNNTNYLVYENYKWEEYTCEYMKLYFPYDIGAVDTVGRVNQDPQGNLYAMRASCVNSNGDMQGYLLPAPGWKAYQNSNCQTCVGTQAYQSAQKAKAAQAYLDAPCHQCPPGWLPDGSKCFPGNNTRQSLLDKNMPDVSLSVATIKQLFPELEWTLCPNTYMGRANVCNQCPPGWKVNSFSGRTCDATSSDAHGLQAYNANTNQQSGFLPQNVSMDQFVQAGITWEESCDPRANPTAASERTQDLWSEGPLTENQINQLRNIPLADWQIRQIQQMWNGQRHYLQSICSQVNMFEQLIGIPGLSGMQVPPSPLPENIAAQYKQICQIVNLRPNTVFGSWADAETGLRQLGLNDEYISYVQHFYDTGQMHQWCANPESYWNDSSLGNDYWSAGITELMDGSISTLPEICNAL